MIATHVEHARGRCCTPRVAQARPVLTGTRPFTWLEEPLQSASWAAACEPVSPPLPGPAGRTAPLLPGAGSRAPPAARPEEPATCPAPCTGTSHAMMQPVVPEPVLQAASRVPQISQAAAWCPFYPAHSLDKCPVEFPGWLTDQAAGQKAWLLAPSMCHGPRSAGACML